MTDLLPCPFCSQQLELVESQAKAFSPPKLYREYHHRNEPECVLGKRAWMFSEDEDKARQAWIEAWNTRALTRQAQVSDKPFPCTCPPDERPTVCQHKYALTDCLASATNSEAVSELRTALENINRRASPRPDRTLGDCADELVWITDEARLALAKLGSRAPSHNQGALTGSHPTDQARSGLGASRVDPARKEGGAL
jgi:hypothetical protein